MMDSDQDMITKALADAESNDTDTANKLVALLYDQLRALAAHYLEDERTGHTLQPTALVHEAYIRLLGHSPQDIQTRSRFFAAAARAMRRVLVDHARRRLTDRRGGGQIPQTLDTAAEPSQPSDYQLVAVNDALTGLAEIEPRWSQVVELHFFAGLTFEEIAGAMGISLRTVHREWQSARTWLHCELNDG